MSAHERERLSAWLDGELPPDERAEVEAHLAACGECAAHLAELGALDEAARELPIEAPSGYFEAFPERVRTRIEAQGPLRARPAAPPPRWRMPAWTWAAAAILLLAVVTPLTLDRLDRGGAPVREYSLARTPKAAAVDLAPADRERSEDVVETKPAEGGLPATPVSGTERDEAGGADRERAAFAAPPAPEPKRETGPGPGASSAGAGTGELAKPPAPAVARANVSAADAAPTAAVVFEGEALGEALGEEPPAVPRPRSQAAMRDVQTPAAAPPAVSSPTKGRMAAPQAAEAQGGLSAEKKTLPEDARDYARLARDTPEGAAAWRERREEWRAFADVYPRSRHVDEARVRTIEAGIEAWRAGGAAEDLDRAQDDARAYLDRDDAKQKERVRHVLMTAPESPR
jgi:anti-sigma factor RsiW